MFSRGNMAFKFVHPLPSIRQDSIYFFLSPYLILLHRPIILEDFNPNWWHEKAEDREVREIAQSYRPSKEKWPTNFSILHSEPTLYFFSKIAMRACMLSHFAAAAAKSLQSCPILCDHMWVARQAPLSMGFYRQEYWNGLPCPPPWDLPDLAIEPRPPAPPALRENSLPLSHWGSPKMTYDIIFISSAK